MGCLPFFRQVEDAQTLMSDGDAVADMESFLFGASVIKQRGQELYLFFVFPVKTDYAAHLVYFSKTNWLHPVNPLVFIKLFSLNPLAVKNCTTSFGEAYS